MNIAKKKNYQEEGSLRTEVLRGKEATSAICGDWDSLFERSLNAPPFLSSTWARVFIEENRLHGKPVYVLVWSNNKLVGLLPLAVRRFLTLKLAEPIGTGVSSYLGLLLDPNYPSAVRCIAESFKKYKVADLFCITNLWSKDEATNALLDELQRGKFLCLRTYRNPCYRIRLGCSYDEYLTQTKNPKRRKKLRYEEKRLFSSANVAIHCYNGKEITAEVLERIAGIQQESWMKRRGAAVLGQRFYQRLLQEAANDGLAKAWLMTIDNQDAAFVYTLTAHRNLHYYRTAFKLQFQSSFSVGKVLTMQVIRDACSNGLLSFDFGQGDGEYKQFWSNACYQVDRVAAGRSLAGRLLVLFYFVIWRLEGIKCLRSLYRRVKTMVLLPRS